MSGDIYHGDCIEEMKTLPANHVDTIITDPPYGLSFMGKEWDKGVPGVPFWAEMLRVSKPGAMLLAFGGTRTFHRMTCAIEDAGWELRDCMMWLYGSGFPKSLDISKAIDKSEGHWRGKAGKKSYANAAMENPNYDRTEKGEPVTAAAKTWNGYGTALKPAWEPIIVAMKPIEGTFAENAERWGVAGLNVDGGRIKSDEKLGRPFNEANNQVMGKFQRFGNPKEPGGRWPANLILDEEAGAMLGEPSRFFYCAKASKSERGGDNVHPTVKPLKLMEYLCTLTKTPTGGIVLDPFAGSGTTGLACANTGRNYILIEREQKYIDIILARLEGK